MAVVLFDLDRTLIDCNSGRLWVQEEWRTGNIGVPTVVWASWYLARYSLGLHDDIAVVFRAALQMVKGQSEADMEARVAEWFAREVAHRLRPGAREALEEHRSRGDRLVLATSSSPYAARAACRHFGLDDAISTRFEVVDGRFTGELLAVAMGEGKVSETERWALQAGVALEECVFYTDSYTDMPLLERVDRPVVVDPDGRLRREAKRRDWPVVYWGSSNS